MANWTALKTAIAAVIKTNGNKEITGAVLQSTLNNIVSNLGLDATYKGFANKSTIPGNPDNNVFYFCNEIGIYPNFGALEITDNQLHILSYSADNNLWSKIKITSNPDAYNVTTFHPLESGQFYTMVTAANAVPNEIRKNGLIVIYESASGVWQKMQFVGTGNNVIFEWGIPIHWVKDDNLMLDLNFMFEKTFDSVASARNIVPLRFRRYGLILQYKLDDGSRICEQYKGTTDYLLSDSWYNSPDFKTVYFNGNVSITEKENLRYNDFLTNGFYNTSLYRKNILGQSLAFDWNGSARNAVPTNYRKKGMIITYCTPDETTWFVERFIGDSIDNPAFYENESWEPIENQELIKTLANTQINIYKQTITPNLDEIKYLLPDKLFFVQNRKLPFYRDSIFLENNKQRLSNWEIIFSTITSKNESLSMSLTDNLIIDGNEVGETLDISIRDKNIVHPYHAKLVESISCDASTKSGQNTKILMIGDSITNRYIPFHTKQILNGHSINANMLGTLTNLGGIKGEGREGWTLSNFLGWENMHGQPSDNETITPSNAIDTTLLQNPFLKLADANDKLYYPDFCFRSTGAKIELSYTDDPIKTGDFYIFSFIKYVTTNLSGNIPSIVTIALGTNDVNKGYMGFYADVTNSDSMNLRFWKSLNFIITNIIEAYPTIKIGIIPHYVRFDNYMWQNGSYSTELINDVILKVRDKNNVNIDVIGVWANMNRYYSSNGKTRNLFDEVQNVDTITNNGDTLHYDEIGQIAIANSLACYIINKI